MDFDLLQIVKKKENFQRFRPYIKEHALSKEGLRVFNGIEDFFRSYPATIEIDWNAFESWFLVLKGATLNKESIQTYRNIFTKLKAGTSSAMLDDVMKHYITKDYATHITNIGIKLAGGDPSATIDQIGELVQRHDKEVGRALTLSDIFETGSVSDAVAAASAPGLEWRLEELNISCGPLRQGDFVVIAARPEVGKTTLAASEVSHMATQLKDKRPVVWVNNEERSSKVKLRIQQAALGWTLKDIAADQAKADAEYDRLMGMKDRILVLKNDSSINSVDRLTSLFREVNPALIVFDQLDKVDGFGSDERDDIRIGRKYKWARDLSHEYGPTIAISQASDAAEGLKWLQQNHLRGSKTDKPGEADLIIGVGLDHLAVNKHARHLHCMKNKLYGGPRSDEKERHGQWEVEIRPEIARYEGSR